MNLNPAATMLKNVNIGELFLYKTENGEKCFFIVLENSKLFFSWFNGKKVFRMTKKEFLKTKSKN